MNDGYEEILIKREKTAADSVKKTLAVVLAAIPIAAGILFLNPVFLLIGAGLAFAVYYLVFPNLDLEYEYLYVNGDIDIDKIMSKRKRKRVGSYSKDNLELMAPDGSDQAASYVKSGKVRDYTSGRADAKAWILVYGGESSSEVLRLELTDSIAQDMRRFAPRKVFFS